MNLFEGLRPTVRIHKRFGKEMRRTSMAIEMRLKRLGVVVMKRKIARTTTTAMKSKGLFTYEETLKILAAVLEDVCKSGQDRLEL